MTQDAAVVDLDRERFYKSQQQAQAKARRDRLALTHGKGGKLAQLQPPLYDDYITTPQVVDYLGISRGTLTALVRIHSDELREAGYVGAGSGSLVRFSRRSVIHLALLLRPNASDQATKIKQMLGVYVPPPAAKQTRWAGHVSSCRTLLQKATEAAEDIQDSDPDEVWNSLSQLDRYSLQGMVVALGSLVPLDQEGIFAKLAALGDKAPVSDRTERADRGKQGHVARGLATLIPATRAEYEANEL